VTNRNNITSHAAASVETAPCASCSLGVFQSRIKVAEVRVEALKEKITLEYLNLFWTGLSDTSARLFALELHNLRALKRLDVSYNEPSTESAELLV
jgi:hypothetical protein